VPPTFPLSSFDISLLSLRLRNHGLHCLLHNLVAALSRLTLRGLPFVVETIDMHLDLLRTQQNAMTLQSLDERSEGPRQTLFPVLFLADGLRAVEMKRYTQ
jgi:hypothetical protein